MSKEELLIEAVKEILNQLKENHQNVHGNNEYDYHINRLDEILTELEGN